jgi:hypothetical protein
VLSDSVRAKRWRSIEERRMRTHVVEWSEPPRMTTGAPLPAIHQLDQSLFVAYVCRNPEFPGWDSGATPEHPGFDIYSAVLRFDGVTWHHFGAPNDESLHEHPLYPFGLRCYGFWEVVYSIPTDPSLRHWIATFHDEILEVVATSACVVSPREAGEDTKAIVLANCR